MIKPASAGFEQPSPPTGFPHPVRVPVPDSRLVRLAALAGRPCPRCGALMLFTGFGLNCSDDRCCYGFSNPEAAESELCPPV